MIAVLGATGYVGRSVARAFAARDLRPLVLFARDPARLKFEACPEHVTMQPLTSFHARDFDLVINCIGAGDPARVAKAGTDLLDVTECWDKRVLETLREDAKYVFLSSGAIYGARFGEGVKADTNLAVPVNNLSELSPYVLAKLIAEFRHRTNANLHILDLRLFAYADPSIPQNGTYFLADLARSVRHRIPFATHDLDFVRDYAGSDELHALISAWESAGAPSGPADVYTLAPISKFEILEEVKRRYRIDVQLRRSKNEDSQGIKLVYASHFKVAAGFEYAPRRTSLEVVRATLDAISASTG